tara:strand:+ start:492 stop:734 length:243 start_codon:yes stop_codon:yes gene_type:complete
MKAIGLIRIEKGLELNNPSLEIVNISYKQVENTVDVECYFKEDNSNFAHSRNFSFAAVSDMLKSDVIALINNHDILKVFV